MDKEAADLFMYNAEVFKYNYNKLSEFESKIPNCADLEELADYGYALKKLAELADDTRKQANKLSEYAQRLQCALQTSLGDLSTVRTEYVTASPSVTYQTSIPKKENDPETYYAICDMLGISREMADVEAVRPHWPGVSEVLTRLQREGKPIPEGIKAESVKPMYSVRYRKKSDSPF